MTPDMPARRLEDRIWELCLRMLYEEEPKWGFTAKELQLAIVEHTRRVENKVTGAVVIEPEVFRERRQRA